MSRTQSKGPRMAGGAHARVAGVRDDVVSALFPVKSK
jgi:hypothetical protein